ncbi:hypothetical protein XELAEV_18018256mg [Xenopus laevis]|uniref:Uncharacterized protein n=1 Tax=Xenopus laevis TaxID=8355 RepID=A0A974DD80_XENLA|nr:hypothetical protein XELAEV_18018256mg [Xenopus laevis]
MFHTDHPLQGGISCNCCSWAEQHYTLSLSDNPYHEWSKGQTQWFSSLFITIKFVKVNRKNGIYVIEFLIGVLL